MLKNAVITSIQAETAPDADGTRHWAANSLTEEIDCLMANPSRSQQITLGELIAGAEFVCYIYDTDLASASAAPDVGYLMTVTLKDDPPIIAEVMHQFHQVGHGTLDHFECFLKTN